MTTEINKEEEIVMYWLKTHGYYKVDFGPNHLVIADGKIRKMIVAVRTPATAEQDYDFIKEFATQKNREPWLAVVEPEDNDITWSSIKI